MTFTKRPMTTESLVAMLAQRSFRRGTFRLASGRESDFYVDVKQTVLTADGASLVGKLLLAELEASAIELVGGMAVGAVPLVAATLCAAAQHGSALTGFFVRKQAKDHGIATVIDGPFRANARIALVEDVVTTGESTLRAVDAVVHAGGRVALVVTVVDRQEDGGMAKIAAQVGTVRALASRATITAAAEKKAGGR